MLAWGPSNDAKAVAVDGGYRINGTWSFASGCRHATWLGGYCPIQEPDGTPRRRPDGSVEGRTMLFPAAQATIVDVWHVTGLRGHRQRRVHGDGSLRAPRAFGLA